VLTAPGIDQSSPLVPDLLGKIDERQGQCEDALARYRCSSWPEHRHRAAMLDIIVRCGDSGGAHLELDKPALEVLQGTDGELDQAELARCSAFLNACLWQPMDDWLIDLELGKASICWSTSSPSGRRTEPGCWIGSAPTRSCDCVCCGWYRSCSAKASPSSNRT